MSQTSQAGKRAPVGTAEESHEIEPETMVVVRPYFSNGGHERRYHLLDDEATVDDPEPACRFARTHRDTEWTARRFDSMVEEAELCTYCDPEVEHPTDRTYPSTNGGGAALSAALADPAVSDPAELDLEEYGLGGDR